MTENEVRGLQETMGNLRQEFGKVQGAMVGLLGSMGELKAKVGELDTTVQRHCGLPHGNPNPNRFPLKYILVLGLGIGAGGALVLTGLGKLLL